MRKREKKPFRQKNIEKQLVAKRKRKNCPWQESCPSDLDTKKCYRASVDTVYKSRITSTKHPVANDAQEAKLYEFHSLLINELYY